MHPSSVERLPFTLTESSVLAVIPARFESTRLPGKILADLGGMQASRRDHDAMIELLAGRDRWALARLCVDHMQPSKLDYLTRVAPDDDR